MNKVNDRAWSAWEFTSLDCAIRAFEVLCEPRYELGEWTVGRWPRGWKEWEPLANRRTATGDHAADVWSAHLRCAGRDGKGPLMMDEPRRLWLNRPDPEDWPKMKNPKEGRD